MYAGGNQGVPGEWTVARWDGSNWSPLGSDTDGAVGALVVDSSNHLYVGGVFQMAGPKLSSSIARYAPSGMPSSLLINHTTGKPGSYFTLSGAGFPAGGTATVTVNGRVLTNALAVDSAGGVAFRLNTGQAGAGRYVATVSVNPSATVVFTLDSSTPLRAQQGSGPTFDVPSGIALTKILYLPLIRR